MPRYPSNAAAASSGLLASTVRVMGVDYQWLRLQGGDDLYLTQHGLPFTNYLLPEKWYNNRPEIWEKLSGSGTVYRIHIKEARGCPIDFVAKFSRIGQDPPGRDVARLDDNLTIEFNSPFEELSILMEMRNSRYEGPGIIRTHKPLGIYVPAERVDPERLGRKAYKFNQITREQGLELDLNRRYVVLYEWVKGIDAVQAAEQLDYNEKWLGRQTLRVEKDLNKKGFRDHDRKPNHVIVRVMPGHKKLIRDRKRRLLYAYIDFEMLRRTPEREKRSKAFRRSDYLVRQRDRFDPSKPGNLPSHLQLVNIFGVDYVYGRVQSTGGALWVVGRDPVLFDYFLPERWRKTPRKKQSFSRIMYYTLTKDNIHIVWRVSRVGEKPDLVGFDKKGKAILDHGFNSPFEEFAMAMDLSHKGLKTIYPRAIYQTGQQTQTAEHMADNSRYESHRHIKTKEGNPILRQDHTYISLWGHWNGPDELLAIRDGNYYSGLNLAHALRDNVINKKTFNMLFKRARERLRSAGAEDLNFHAHHFLVSRDNKGRLIKEDGGLPELRISNFELLKRIE